jgi:two-component system LytT family response regulator
MLSILRVDLVDVDSIDWFEAASNYVVLHCGSRQYTIRGPLGRVCALLDPCQFVRVHRSFVVRLSRIQRFEPILRGDWTAVLADGTQVLVSRNHRRRVFEAACWLRATP